MLLRIESCVGVSQTHKIKMMIDERGSKAREEVLVWSVDASLHLHTFVWPSSDQKISLSETATLPVVLFVLVDRSTQLPGTCTSTRGTAGSSGGSEFKHSTCTGTCTCTNKNKLLPVLVRSYLVRLSPQQRDMKCWHFLKQIEA